MSFAEAIFIPNIAAPIRRTRVALAFTRFRLKTVTASSGLIASLLYVYIGWLLSQMWGE